jgi:hypothetical protein
MVDVERSDLTSPHCHSTSSARAEVTFRKRTTGTRRDSLRVLRVRQDVLIVNSQFHLHREDTYRVDANTHWRFASCALLAHDKAASAFFGCAAAARAVTESRTNLQ